MKLNGKWVKESCESTFAPEFWPDLTKFDDPVQNRHLAAFWPGLARTVAIVGKQCSCKKVELVMDESTAELEQPCKCLVESAIVTEISANDAILTFTRHVGYVSRYRD